MNPPGAQFDASKKNSFEPQSLGSSELEFSAGCNMAGEKPGFVVDSGEIQTEPAGSVSTPSLTQSPSSPQQSLSRNGLSQEEGFCPDTPAPQPQPEIDWRHLVSAKVKNYKSRKPRKEHYPSLQLQFEASSRWNFDKTPKAVAVRDDSFTVGRPNVSQTVPEAEAGVSFEATTEATARVLEFPRPGLLPFNRDELAEPVIDHPRILEAPELLPPPPALGGILMESSNQPEPERRPGFDMPLSTARLWRRGLAAAIDGVFVAAGLAIFGYLFMRFNPALPQMRAAVELAAALLAMFWFAYQSAFLVFCGTTPGLRAARLKIARFDGTPAPRNLRRWRVLASGLSCFSLGLGYLWCLFDEDQLSWHDRITRTHLAPRN
jgi:uncharacterized RDD family membrane protein YckC